jgi:hypothetical protein
VAILTHAQHHDVERQRQRVERGVQCGEAVFRGGRVLMQRHEDG